MEKENKTSVNEVKELIVQKQQKYAEISDEAKRKNADKTMVTGLALAAMLAGVGGIVASTGGFYLAASLIATGTGAYTFFRNIPNYAKNLVVRYKSMLAKRRLNKALKTIDSLNEQPKIKTK